MQGKLVALRLVVASHVGVHGIAVPGEGRVGNHHPGAQRRRKIESHRGRGESLTAVVDSLGRHAELDLGVGGGCPDDAGQTAQHRAVVGVLAQEVVFHEPVSLLPIELRHVAESLGHRAGRVGREAIGVVGAVFRAAAQLPLFSRLHGGELHQAPRRVAAEVGALRTVVHPHRVEAQKIRGVGEGITKGNIIDIQTDRRGSEEEGIRETPHRNDVAIAPRIGVHEVEVGRKGAEVFEGFDPETVEVLGCEGGLVQIAFPCSAIGGSGHSGFGKGADNLGANRGRKRETCRADKYQGEAVRVRER